MMRDTRQTKEHFDKRILFCEQQIEIQISKIATNTGIAEGNRPLAVRILQMDLLKRIILCYSCGDELALLSQQVHQLIDATVLLRTEIAARPEKEQKGLQQFTIMTLDKYVDCFWMFSLAVNLKLPPTQILRLLDSIGNVGVDTLFDRIAQKFQPTRSIGPEIRFAKPYQPLLDALDAAPDKQPKLVKTFLDKWYPGLKRIAWWGRAEKNSEGYFGYWCFEAALVVRLFGIDDSSFADHPYYPKDLAHFA